MTSPQFEPSLILQWNLNSSLLCSKVKTVLSHLGLEVLHVALYLGQLLLYLVLFGLSI